MIPYGMKKRGSGKLHPHDKCDVCAENRFNKKTMRQDAKKHIKQEFIDRDETQCLHHEIQEYFDQKYIDELEIKLGINDKIG